ncbi:hypothetical protein SNOG_11560 [Parastagonospora nodorum SN15]|uniref:Uncharacterized protein n=1 Tax=Phaeosphaeria nodorum (strain SN15 / ATCC MYA-4574 / FGSC 10173) TaxID=321614 RepID=Q0U9K4_PHANO|nr:hypothetical protein SNOG_11560 [Parastagonospora nodorum SN15]EAT81268.1 hypothetical protein SNOG_11560 [Parastagonospora nodorum SN15]
MRVKGEEVMTAMIEFDLLVLAQAPAEVCDRSFPVFRQRKTVPSLLDVADASPYGGTIVLADIVFACNIASASRGSLIHNHQT